MSLLERTRSLFAGKLSRDIAWTIGSFAILAASGLVINIVVVSARDAAALGVFNQAYAVYMVASQLAVFGLHYSVLRHAAYHEAEPDQLGRLLPTAGACAAVLGLLMAALVLVLAPHLGRYFGSEETGRAIAWSAAGLLLFPLNKVLVFYLNGLRRMRMFSILQGTRYLVVMACVTTVAYSHWSFEHSTLALFVAEFVTTAGALIYIAVQRLAPHPHFDGGWARKHFVFGAKSLFSGMFAEMNSRVDVLLLGLLLSDRAVGIYSFAAMLVDGLYHVLAMVRVNFNPLLVAAARDHRWESAQQLLRQTRRYAYPATAVLCACTIGGMLLLAYVITPGKSLAEGVPALVILLSGLLLVSPYIPFDNLLLATGHPVLQTVQQMAVVFGNAAINIVLVPHLGIEGAAIATAVSYAISSGMMIVLARRVHGWNLLTNRITV